MQDSEESVELAEPEAATLEEVQAIIDSCNITAELIKKKGLELPKSYSNSILLASSFVRYKKIDKARTYAKQSVTHLQKIDADIYNAVEEMILLQKELEKAEMLDIETDKYTAKIENIRRDIEAGDLLNASNELKRLRQSLYASFGSVGTEILQETERLISESADEGVNTEQAELKVDEAYRLFDANDYPKAFEAAYQARKKLAWARELKFKTKIKITPKTKEEIEKEETEKKRIEDESKQLHARVSAQIFAISTRLKADENGNAYPPEVYNYASDAVTRAKLLIKPVDGNPPSDKIPANSEPAITTVKCYLCQGAIKTGLLIVNCPKCNKKYHESCANRATFCAKCNSELSSDFKSRYEVALEQIEIARKALSDYAKSGSIPDYILGKDKQVEPPISISKAGQKVTSVGEPATVPVHRAVEEETEKTEEVAKPEAEGTSSDKVIEDVSEEGVGGGIPEPAEPTSQEVGIQQELQEEPAPPPEYEEEVVQHDQKPSVPVSDKAEEAPEPLSNQGIREKEGMKDVSAGRDGATVHRVGLVNGSGLSGREGYINGQRKSLS
ncbi:MAG: hypothetical protein QW728_07960, partial [Thermoplasmata archaeon]